MRQVDVWRLALAVSDGELARMLPTLSVDEVDRAGRLSDPAHRRQCLVARSFVRRVLAGYLGADPVSLRFVRGPFGKPALAPVTHQLRFNLARSGDLALLAVTRGREVGIDVERIAPPRALGPIADQLFGEDEAAELRGMSDEARVRRFFQLWTSKEAYAKALGLGLAVPLKQVRIPAGWLLRELPLDPGYAAALCVRGRRFRVRVVR